MAILETIVRQLTTFVALIVDGAAMLVVALAIFEALLGAGRLRIAHPRRPDGDTAAVRLRLGRWLSVALELLLAADILRTAMTPTWDDIGKLSAIAGIRTALNYFLQIEVREASRASDAALNRPAPHD